MPKPARTVFLAFLACTVFLALAVLPARAASGPLPLEPGLRSAPYLITASISSVQPITDTFTLAASWTYSRWSPGSQTWLEMSWTTGDGTYSNMRLPYNATSAYVGGARPDARYRLYLRNCADDGCTGWMSAAPITTPPAQPRNVSVTWRADSTSATVRWSDESSTENRFEIGYRTPGSTGLTHVSATTPAGATSVTLTGVPAASAYFFSVRSCNAGACAVWVERYASAG